MTGLSHPGDSNSLRIGNPKLNALGFNCCGKPKGCTNQNSGCAYLQHPYKRVRGEITLVELQSSVIRQQPN